ncbi:T9SS type A sorting domain-containing protein [Polaribacter sp. Z022]|uniref:T9SS type A sorting domain-containing protein n=1 Tax=Polaribacter sp. Z022 TaxID=2927125 RepID=UPI0020225262|nr:T9SS type A sorting domain-containing protein [Polaribacter sp. Z022]MCL7754672.1 T9SS type A sorting domain-containing protein [Polaribacter sp. Z022]
MNKIFSPKNLSHSIVLIFSLICFQTFSQNVDVKITVNWPNWSSENKIELLAVNGTVLATVDNGYTGSGNAAFDNISSPSVTSVTVNSSANAGYSVKIYDLYGDGWNGSGYATINVDGVDVLTVNDSNFDNIPGSGGEISKRVYFAVNQVVVLDDASFSYSKSGYCQVETDPTPNVTGETGGTFSSTSGLVLNSTSGQIDLSASTLGSYVVTYTTTAPNQNSATFNVTISDGDVATFEYTTSSATQSSSDLSPTVTGASGIFSSTTGLSINSSTGVIDVSASTVGVYTVSYITTGSCTKVYTDQVEILGAFPGVSQYYNSSKKYIEYIPGTMPVIISAPHGGTLTGSELSTRGCGTGEMDDNTDILIREIQKNCYEQFGVYPYIIINNLRRNKLDPNRNESVATCGNSSAKPYFDAYHGFIDDASADVSSKFGKGLYIDLHGQSHSIPRIEAGYNLPSSSFDEDLNNSSTNVAELARVTIKNLINNNLQNLTFEDLIRGSQSFGGLMQTTGGTEYAALGHAGCSRSVGYRTVPSHVKTGSDQGSCDDTNPGNNSYFAGDYYSNIRHGSGSTSYANSVVGGGGTVNGGGGTIDGLMTEVNRRVRDLGSAYSSEYGRSDSRSATVPYFSRDYAQVLENFIEIHYNDFSNFSYDSNAYSIYGLDPTPTITGISGGTFTSTSGLSINSSTGQIDVSNSTTGTYTVKYVALNVGDYYKKEFSVTINNSAVTNTFTATNGVWSSTSNWSLGRLPASNDNVSIPSGKIAHLDLENITVTDVSVEGTLNVKTGKSITVSGNINTTGTTVVKTDATSSGSIIVNGTSTGNITFSKSITDSSNWYLISSPVENQDIDALVSANNNIATSGTKRGLATYNNVSKTWDYYINGSSTSGNFTLGEGYSVKLNSLGSINFTGNLKTENVNKNVTLGANGWNLIGNTYLSFISVNNSADNTNNILDLATNFSILETGYKAIYYWDTDSNTYKPINNASDATFLAPGQAYFVKVNANGNITLNENMQSHQSGNHFLKSNSDRFEIKLTLNNGTSKKDTHVKYIKGTTTGLDEGYDAGLFNANSSSFDIYTHLVAPIDDTKYALQALPNSNFESMVVPVGVIAKVDSEITFKGEFKNIPKGVKIYLEDKKENVFKRIDETDASYKITLEEDINGVGRFFIHTSSKTLTVQNIETKPQFSLYQSNKGVVRILGVDSDDTVFKLISVLGKEMYATKLANKQSQEIVLPKLNAGIYIAQIKSKSEKISKKIILK